MPCWCRWVHQDASRSSFLGSRSSCSVPAASYDAKAFGVRGGMPGRQARELCPELQFVNGHFQDYQRLGDAAVRVIGDFTLLVDRISIDEVFADVAGCTHLFGPPVDIAKKIRKRVRAELGLAISVGMVRTKHLAKTASQVAKPDGLVVVDLPRRWTETVSDIFHARPSQVRPSRFFWAIKFSNLPILACCHHCFRRPS